MLIEVVRPGFTTVYVPGLPAELIGDISLDTLTKCVLGVCSNCGAVEHGVQPYNSRERCGQCGAWEALKTEFGEHVQRGTLMRHSTHYHRRSQ
jgi:hypothetical protein